MRSDAKNQKYAELDEHIDALRDIYWQLPTIKRSAFLAYIVSRVLGSTTRHSKKKDI
jgi:hypothetical protein